MRHFDTLDRLHHAVTRCCRCPRLVEFRQAVPPRASFRQERYWRRPVSGYGDDRAKLLLVGLAPAAHGANRTGRIFTGDPSARFLMHCLHAEGLASQPTSERADDGLRLLGCYMTAAVKCVPPQNKPSREEINTCRPFLAEEFRLLPTVQAVLALGKLAFDAFCAHAKESGADVKGLRFHHGGCWQLKGFATIYASYHPSPQNTNTGLLTEAMFREVLRQIKNDHNIRTGR